MALEQLRKGFNSKFPVGYKHEKAETYKLITTKSSSIDVVALRRFLRSLSNSFYLSSF